MRILVTGATGFVGRSLCEFLAQSGHVVRAALRADTPLPHGASEKAIVGDICADTVWGAALNDVHAVIHAAARVHVLRSTTDSPDLHFQTNARGTQRLAEACAVAGVSRLVFLSSIKVNGEETGAHPYTALDEPQPQDPYGMSKRIGEQLMMEVAAGSSLEVAIVRPPLVYGPGVRANFLRLMRWIDRELPMPFGAIENRRSLVSIYNLSDFLLHVLVHPAAAGRVWLVSDGEDLSTSALIRRIAQQMHRRARLVPVPESALRALGFLTGHSSELKRLCGSLAVDINAARTDLGWSPPVGVDDGLARTVDWYLNRKRPSVD